MVFTGPHSRQRPVRGRAKPAGDAVSGHEGFSREFSFAGRTVMDESMITEGRYAVGTQVGSALVLAARLLHSRFISLTEFSF